MLFDEARLEEIIKRAVREVLSGYRFRSAPPVESVELPASSTYEKRGLSPDALLQVFEAWGAWCDANGVRANPRATAGAKAASTPGLSVYFVQAAPGPIKIGVARVVSARVAELQTASPYALRVLLVIPGDQTLEHAFHSAVHHARMRSEWFHPAPELLKLVELLCRCNADWSFEERATRGRASLGAS